MRSYTPTPNLAELLGSNVLDVSLQPYEDRLLYFTSEHSSGMLDVILSKGVPLKTLESAVNHTLKAIALSLCCGRERDAHAWLHGNAHPLHFILSAPRASLEKKDRWFQLLSQHLLRSLARLLHIRASHNPVAESMADMDCIIKDSIYVRSRQSTQEQAYLDSIPDAHKREAAFLLCTLYHIVKCIEITASTILKSAEGDQENTNIELYKKLNEHFRYAGRTANQVDSWRDTVCALHAAFLFVMELEVQTSNN